MTDDEIDELVDQNIKHYQSKMFSFLGSIVADDPKRAASYRLELHDLLDVILDLSQEKMINYVKTRKGR